ncbi:MAG TPA: FxsA family protein [Geopsychrobacteraceae bacterium]|nr:FxsA family protein [Geopsychrobacteraceae bacterium]
MFIRLLILFTFIPILELYVLLEIGSLLGTLATVALIFLTGIAGAYLARMQGFSLINKIQSEMNQGRVPRGELVDGAMILVGGVLLLTPGFCTDLLGFSLLVPLTRNLHKEWLTKWLEKVVAGGQIHIRRF